MDSHVKERIVGAAVLVALGVWLIPWVLDGPDPAPEAPAEPTGIVLPPAEEAAAPVRTETVDLEPDAAEPDGAAEAPVVAENESDTSESVADEPELVAAEPAATEPATGQNPQASAPVPEPEPVAAEPASRGGWSVQLGAFSQIANAEQLSARVSTYGYRAYVADFRSGGNTLYRVRVGGFATEAEAEAAASSLAAHDFRVRVVRPE